MASEGEKADLAGHRQRRPDRSVGMGDSANHVGCLGDERCGVRACGDRVGGAGDSVRQELAATRHPGARKENVGVRSP